MIKGFQAGMAFRNRQRSISDQRSWTGKFVTVLAWLTLLSIPTSAICATVGLETVSTVNLLGGLYTDFQIWVDQTQSSINRQLTTAIKNIKETSTVAAGVWLILLSFGYGLVHAAGPGHGKVVISSYVLANQQTARRGIYLAFGAALIQALSAIFLVVGFIWLLGATGFEVKRWSRSLELASYGLITALGCWLLVTTVMKIYRSFKGEGGHEHQTHANQSNADNAKSHHQGCRHGHSTHEGHACGHQHMPSAETVSKIKTFRQALPVIFSVGIRPCTGAILVLVFALTQGLLIYGIFATFAMALGTFVTVTILMLMAVGGRELAIISTGSASSALKFIYYLTSIGGSLLILLIGITLFVNNMGPARPF